MKCSFHLYDNITIKLTNYGANVLQYEIKQSLIQRVEETRKDLSVWLDRLGLKLDDFIRIKEEYDNHRICGIHEQLIFLEDRLEKFYVFNGNYEKRLKKDDLVTMKFYDFMFYFRNRDLSSYSDEYFNNGIMEVSNDEPNLFCETRDIATLF